MSFIVLRISRWRTRDSKNVKMNEMKNSKTFSSSRRREVIDVNCIALTRITNTKLNVNLLMSLFVKQQIKKLTKCIEIETKIIKIKMKVVNNHDDDSTHARHFIRNYTCCALWQFAITNVFKNSNDWLRESFTTINIAICMKKK